LAVTGAEIGFAGANQIIAVERILAEPKSKFTPWKREVSYYITSLSENETTLEELLELSIGHWDAIENGTHYVRDVCFGEDACRIHQPNAARNMVTLRNFVNGLYQIEHQHIKKEKRPSLLSWQRSMKEGQAIKLLRGKL
jgi:predicted transposase YbfD/YdcC